MTLPEIAEPLPSSYTFGKVVGRVVHLIADTAEDADDKPQARSAAGKVTFTPKDVLRKTTDANYPALVLHAKETATLSNSGRVLDAEGRQGIWLAAGHYTVTFEIVGAPRAIPDFNINVTTEHQDPVDENDPRRPLDLAKEAPYVPPTGTVVQTLVVPSGGTDGQALVRSADGGLTWATLVASDPAIATRIGDDASQTSAALGAAIDSGTHPLGAAARAAYALALPVATVSRDATGRITSITEDGITSTYTRDALGRVETITRGSVTRTVTRTASGTIGGIA